ncbi:N-acetyltransferase [Pseudomonas sp. TKO26]|uniref:GNAT family N-acetyltransferase n=1 Tax=unclassified Pseudomonas TaxID=196821 RepID=UPI000D8FDC0C|nr:MULTISPECIES: GNAT family N-acetyltransferase [unclassified Pseudomonas]PYY84762.1 N-acetyltransferase [Pseudomonas sp. TKO30]PYY86671.1 N-acetyltransferase [Pseudomonas sp. TKO29]PYY89313.1 N-acetyltransferase [Pseudomonas sp. TKO26]PYY99142.1 N-acetyltransferase [Pseudomonas sp. TKO14]
MLELHTTRLHLRPLSAHDWELFLSLHSDPDNLRYVCDPLSRDQIEERFTSRLPRWDFDSTHWLCLVIRDRQSGEDLGLTGLRISDRDAAEAEVGYLLARHHQGRGVAAESLRGLMEHARQHLGIKRLVATVTDGNAASCQVLEKCGFVFLRRDERAFRQGGEDFDDLIFSCHLTA